MKLPALVFYYIILASKICIQAVTLCLSKGYLPLKLKGYQVAMSLQNPYLVLDPKLGVAVKVFSFFKLGIPKEISRFTIS